MPLIKRNNFTKSEIKKAYKKTGSITGMASELKISYPTAKKWAKDINLTLNKQGYNKPKFDLTGSECRRKRELYGLSRECLCNESKVSETALREFELGNSTLRKKNMEKITETLRIYKITRENN